MQENQFTCLIPFFNENWRIISVLKKLNYLVQEGKIQSIICVDDGSTDNTRKLISKAFAKSKKIKVVGYKQNSGKSAAIKFGLDFVDTSHIMLFDADLNSFSTNVIEQALDAFNDENKIDALIFRQSNDPWISKILRHDLIVSGERILKRSDLREIFEDKLSNYQVEFAINSYLSKNNKNTLWIPFYSKNHFKLDKWSHEIALKKTVQFQKELFRIQYLKQWLFFKPRQLLFIL